MSDNVRMTPAVLDALLRGDMENAMIAATPGGIEAQEARGQQTFVASETLPLKCNFCTREQLEQMGIVFTDEIDSLFVRVHLPDGWHKVPTDHSMWTDLVDEKGRKRAAIFYKAAFYDRDAHISLVNRFGYAVEPVCGYANADYRAHEWHCTILDCGAPLVVLDEKLEPEPAYPQRGSETYEQDRMVWLAWSNRKDELGKAGAAWLDENYPNWRDPLAYWND